MPGFTDVSYGKMLAFLAMKKSVRETAEALRVSERTVRYWVAQGHPPSETVREHRLSFQHRVEERRQAVQNAVNVVETREGVAYTPVRRKRKVRLISIRPFGSPARIGRLLNGAGFETSLSTSRRDLLALGLSARRTRRGPVITPRNCFLRVDFAKKVLERGNLNIIFSDETMIDSNEHGGWQWVAFGQTPDTYCVEQGAPKLLLWGAIGIDFRFLVVLPRTILNGQRFVEEVLKKALPALKKKCSEGAEFQQDNSPVHRPSYAWLRRRGVKLLAEKWPAVSCDLNPIEQVWQWLDAAVARRGPYGVEELEQFVREEFAAIPTESLNKLVLSFATRLEKVIEQEGLVVKP